MKIKSYILFCFCSLCIVSVAQNKYMALDDALGLGLPVVEVVTVDSIEPTAEEAVKQDERSSGHSIVNATKVPGRLRIWSPDSVLLFDSGDYQDGKSGMTIKIRGNNSAFMPLKPYKVKLQKKHDLLLRGNQEHFRDKNWLLLKEYKNTLNIPIGFKVNELLNNGWTPACQHVNLLFNGEFRGVYLLTEQVRRNPLCRIDVDEDTGYIIERDIYWWVESLSFESVLYNGYWQRYTFKYPEAEDVTEEQMDYIREAVNQMECAVIAGQGYEEFMDVMSFASWTLGHDLLGTEDGGGANRYLVKYDNTPDSKFRMGPLWDFDTSFRKVDEWSTLHTDWTGYAKRLFPAPDNSYKEAYIQAWKRLSPILETKLFTFLDSLAIHLGAALDTSRIIEQNLFYRSFASVNDNVRFAKEYFTSRKIWMDEQVALMDSLLNGINTVDFGATRKPSGILFDLSGRPVSTKPKRGIYIANGRKRVVTVP